MLGHTASSFSGYRRPKLLRNCQWVVTMPSRFRRKRITEGFDRSGSAQDRKNVATTSLMIESERSVSSVCLQDVITLSPGRRPTVLHSSFVTTAPHFWYKSYVCRVFPQTNGWGPRELIFAKAASDGEDSDHRGRSSRSEGPEAAV